MVQRKTGGGSRGRKRAVIFDFDGTIADSLPAVIATFEELTSRPERFTPEQIESMRALSLPELMTELHVSKWKAPFLLLRGRRMLRAHLHGIAVHKGVVNVIKKLHEEGVVMYVLSSNSTENVQSYLHWHKLNQYFAGVYGGASLLGKAPRLFKLIEAEKLDVARSWYVGDETRDVTAARSVGFKSASVTWGYNTKVALTAKEPDLLVDTPAALLKGLESVWKK